MNEINKIISSMNLEGLLLRNNSCNLDCLRPMMDELKPIVEPIMKMIKK